MLRSAPNGEHFRRKFREEMRDLAIKEGNRIRELKKAAAAAPTVVAAPTPEWKPGDPLPDNVTEKILRQSKIEDIVAWRERQRMLHPEQR